jgi:N6-L-threonylcarbamoyladenine synthase
MRPIILAIESSCDETSAAVISNGKLLNNIVASQSDHAKYGGVVPELASRAHQRQIVTVVNEALVGAGVSKGDLDAIALQWKAMGCDANRPVCKCAQPPPVACKAATCGF